MLYGNPIDERLKYPSGSIETFALNIYTVYGNDLSKDIQFFRF